MALHVSQVQVWAAGIEDRPGGTAEKLQALAEAGANLEFAVARRTPETGGGVLFVTPVESGVREAARSAGFQVAEGLHSVRVEGPDAPGLGARLAGALASAGINLRGMSAAAIDGKMVCYLAFDSSDDAAKAREVLAALD